MKQKKIEAVKGLISDRYNPLTPAELAWLKKNKFTRHGNKFFGTIEEMTEKESQMIEQISKKAEILSINLSLATPEKMLAHWQRCDMSEDEVLDRYNEYKKEYADYVSEIQSERC